MNLDDQEVAVVCSFCNSYLHAVDETTATLYAHHKHCKKEGDVLLIACPYKQDDGTCEPPLEQRYGRS